MDLLRFFLVSYHCLVGVSKNIPFNPCNATFLLSIGRGSLSSEHISAAAATCEMLWPNHGWHNYNIFVGFNITERCPAMNQCTYHTNWTNETLPISNSPESKYICETGATGCCENNTIANVRNCIPFRVYFHRTSKGCDEAYCYVNGPDVHPILGKRANSGHTDN